MENYSEHFDSIRTSVKQEPESSLEEDVPVSNSLFNQVEQNDSVDIDIDNMGSPKHNLMPDMQIVTSIDSFDKMQEDDSQLHSSSKFDSPRANHQE